MTIIAAPVTLSFDLTRTRECCLPGSYAPQAFDKDAVQGLLTNAVYAGYVTYAGSDEHGNRRRKPVEWFDGKHEALVSLELFRKVQTIRHFAATTAAPRWPTRRASTPSRACSTAQPSTARCAASPRTAATAPLPAGAYILRGPPLPAAVGKERMASAEPARRLDRAEDQRSPAPAGDLVTSIHLPAAWRERILT